MLLSSCGCGSLLPKTATRLGASPLGVTAAGYLGSVFGAMQQRTATKKAGGSSRNGRDSPGQRLGLKKFGGHAVVAGNIIVRQRGLTFKPGEGVGLGRDYTIYALKPGYVRFEYHPHTKKQFVHVVESNPNIPKKDKQQSVAVEEEAPQEQAA